MDKTIAQSEWLATDANEVMKVPLLVKGQLVPPPDVGFEQIRRAFAPLDESCGAADPPATCVTVNGAQVVRERIVEHDPRRLTDRYRYHVMPTFAATDLIERDIDRLSAQLYSLRFEQALEWLDCLRQGLATNSQLLARVCELDLQTSEHPEPYVRTAYAALTTLLSPSLAAQMVDTELGREGVVGRRFLDEWVPIEGAVNPGPVHLIGGSLLADTNSDPPSTGRPLLRALPTRQLHFTAGNSPLVPLVSLLRLVWTKSAGVIKLPYGATLPGMLLAIIAATVAPEHPITQNLSMVYWPGGDEHFEQRLFLPGAFDRIVVWGAPTAVASVAQRALFTKTLSFNPRYSVSFIGSEALTDLEDTARRAVCDTMVQNQKACIASQVHYVEGDSANAERYARVVRRVLAQWDTIAPSLLTPQQQGKIKKLQRGALLDASFHLNQLDGFQSGVVVVPNEFRITDHPMCRLVIVRPIKRLEDCLRFLHQGVSTVGIHPESRRQQLRDLIAARGVSNIVPLGQAARSFTGMAHDGMLVLSELVDWKNG